MKFRVLSMLVLAFLASCQKSDEPTTSQTSNSAASEKKEEVVLNLAVTAKIKGLDPIYTDDLYSSNEAARIYEGLLNFHYLKRPYTLEANLAEALPKVSDDGITYTFKLKKGVMFHDDSAFPGGKGRELVAEDVVYSIKRLADPKLQSSGWWLLQDRLAGLDEWREKNSKEAVVNYEQEIDGLKALDKYTLQFKLKKPFPQFLYALAMPFTYVVAKEAVEKYGQEFLNHPVGTGPYLLPKFDQTSRIVYKKNPNYRERLYPSEGSAGDREKGLLEDAGKKIPFADKIVVNIIEESQPRWLNLLKGKVDFVSIPKDNFDSAVTPDKNLAPDLVEKGFFLDMSPSLDVTFIAFNHEQPLFKNNVNLRRAMSLAYDVNKSLDLFYNKVGVPAQSVIPPGIAGYIQGYKNPYAMLDLEKAKKLLAEAGYPEGKGLPEIVYETTSNTTNRQMAEFFRQCMEKIGITIKVSQNTWPELQKKVKTKNNMMFGMAWRADYPDAENFLQLMYGPNQAPGANGSNYNNPEFNTIFEKARLMQDSPERTALYERLNRMAAEQVPWIFGIHREAFSVQTGWLKNFKYTEFTAGRDAYLNVDLAKKAELKEKL